MYDDDDNEEEEEEEESKQGLGGKFSLRESFNEDKAEIFKERRGAYDFLL